MKNPIPYLYAAGLMVCAGVSPNATAAEPSAPAEATAGSRFWPWTVGVEFGSTGAGASGSWRFADHWAMGGELGVAYTGDPKASLSWADHSHPVIDAVWRHEQARVQSWADQFTWFPVVKLNVNYSF
jgi:hypothetical protein